MDKLFIFLTLVLSVLSICLSICFFVYQGIENGRSPWSIFFGPINRAEFKQLLKIIESGSVVVEDSVLDSKITFNKEFVLTISGYSDKLTINGVRLSYIQEKSLWKAINRRALKTHLLTKTGNLIYGKE